MTLEPTQYQFWYNILSMVVGGAFTAGGVYVAIKKDLKRLQEKIIDNHTYFKESVQRAQATADDAHIRINEIFEKGYYDRRKTSDSQPVPTIGSKRA